jgi:predicted outer membrane protein
MDARFHHRVAWIIAAALGGVAACAGGGGGPTAGKAGGHDCGVASADCLGPTWFGGFDTAARSKLVGLVCADARSGSIAADRLDKDAGPSCKGAYSVRSDDQIEALLTALDEGEMREAKLAEAKATAPAVRDFAHEISEAHARSSEEAKARLERHKQRSEDSDLSRSVTAGFKACEDALQGTSASSFDDEFLARIIVEHAREVEMLDAVVSQTKSDATRCYVEKARNVALSHLQLACTVSSKVGATPPAMKRPRPSQRVGKVSSGAAACTEQESPVIQEPPVGAVATPPEQQEPAAVATPPEQQEPAAAVAPPEQQEPAATAAPPEQEEPGAAVAPRQEQKPGASSPRQSPHRADLAPSVGPNCPP